MNKINKHWIKTVPMDVWGAFILAAMIAMAYPVLGPEPRAISIYEQR